PASPPMGSWMTGAGSSPVPTRSDPGATTSSSASGSASTCATSSRTARRRWSPPRSAVTASTDPATSASPSKATVWPAWRSALDGGPGDALYGGGHQRREHVIPGSRDVTARHTDAQVGLAVGRLAVQEQLVD